MSYYAIVALTKNNGMAFEGKIPWRVPEDFKYFRTFSMGKTCVMGRNTYEDLLTYAKNKQDPLPGRKLVVITKFNIFLNDTENVTFITSLDKLFTISGDICFIGGRRIYEEAARLYTNIYLSVTRLNFEKEPKCDTFFEPLKSGFKLLEIYPLENTPHMIEIYRN